MSETFKDLKDSQSSQILLFYYKKNTPILLYTTLYYILYVFIAQSHQKMTAVINCLKGLKQSVLACMTS